MKKLCLTLLCLLAVFAFCTPASFALPAFKKDFAAKYTKKSDNETFKAAVKKQGCNVCHIKGKKKDVRNAYGDALAELIEGDAKDRIKIAKEKGADDAEKKAVQEELLKAFDLVEKEKSPSGETFGELLKSGKLPVEPSKPADEDKK